jgi:hypothetical protein
VTPPPVRRSSNVPPLGESAQVCFACAAISQSYQPGTAALFGALAALAGHHGVFETTRLLCEPHQRVWVSMVGAFAGRPSGEALIDRVREAVRES